MRAVIHSSVSRDSLRLTLFVFFGLLFLSTAIFVFADDSLGAKNIFQDSDQDGLSNDEEKLYGTDPFNKDSDGDGYRDGVEVESGYDPLKPAPGDKIVKEGSVVQASPEIMGDSENLTEKVSGEIASILKDNAVGTEQISLEDINTSVQKVLAGSAGDIVLPEVDIKGIKIKKLPKSLKGDARKERERQDALEYLTVLAYSVANNMPQTFQTQDELRKIFTNIAGQSVAALSSNNFSYLNQLSQKNEKILSELQNVEVPEKMLNMHIKVLQMVRYGIQLKDEFALAQTDPLGQIAVLSKIQGFFGSAQELIGEVHQQLVEYGIEEIPLNL